MKVKETETRDKNIGCGEAVQRRGRGQHHKWRWVWPNCLSVFSITILVIMLPVLMGVAGATKKEDRVWAISGKFGDLFQKEEQYYDKKDNQTFSMQDPMLADAPFSDEDAKDLIR